MKFRKYSWKIYHASCDKQPTVQVLLEEMASQAESCSLGHNLRVLELCLNPGGQNGYNQSHWTLTFQIQKNHHYFIFNNCRKGIKIKKCIIELLFSTSNKTLMVVEEKEPVSLSYSVGVLESRHPIPILTLEILFLDFSGFTGWTRNGQPLSSLTHRCSSVTVWLEEVLWY